MGSVGACRNPRIALPREPDLVEGDGETEVARLGGSVLGEPHIARLEVVVDEAGGVCPRQRLADRPADLQRRWNGYAVLRCADRDRLQIPAGHQLGDVVLRPLYVRASTPVVGATPKKTHGGPTEPPCFNG